MATVKTERGWLLSTTPDALLRALKGKRLPRQRRLFAVACCRRVLGAMVDPESRLAVEVAERFADGLASSEDLSAAYRAAQEVALHRLTLCQEAPEEKRAGAWAVWRLAYAAQLCSASSGTENAALELLRRARHLGEEHEVREKEAQCQLLRDIVANPFRPRPALAPVFAGRGSCVADVALTIYEQRRFGDLPVLADALEEAGCVDADLLGHLRSSEPHAPGCWALDLILDKQ